MSLVTAAIRSAELSTEQTSISMEELSQTLVAHYWVLQFNWTKKSKGKEFSVFAGETRLCNYCKKKGHIVKDCPRLKKKKESDLLCTICNKQGHLAVNCSEKPANKGKVPEWYKKLKAKQAEKGTLAKESQKANL